MYYYEKRSLQKPIATLGGDIARHLQLRQHLGTSVVVCENPIAILSATRKQWLRLSRLIQRRRASTLNAEEILRYTRSIMHMQHMRFVARPPLQDSMAHVFFITPEDFDTLPPDCFSIYLTIPIKNTEVLTRLPTSSLVVEYGDLQLTLPGAPRPKEELEEIALDEWRHLTTFLEAHSISVTELSNDNPFHSRVLDEALDTLLDANHDFLRLAFNFQHALSLAQPLALINAEQQRIFDIVLRLAHRVHSLTPSSLRGFVPSSEFGLPDSYFLRDRAAEISEILHHGDRIDQPYLPYETATI